LPHAHRALRTARAPSMRVPRRAPHALRVGVQPMSESALSPADIMRELRVGRSTAYAIARQLPCVMVGRLRRVPRAAFDAWVREHTESAPLADARPSPVR